MKDVVIKEWFVVRKSNELGRNASINIFAYIKKSDKAVYIMDNHGLIYWVPVSALEIEDSNEEGGADYYDNPEEVKTIMEEIIKEFGLCTYEEARKGYRIRGIE